MTGPHESSVTLLLVEDNPDDARFVQRLLHEQAHDPLAHHLTEAGTENLLEVTSVEHVGRLDAALDRLEQSPAPDVVLLDLQLPDSDGLVTVEAVVGAQPTVPIVVLTGQSEGAVGVSAIRRGADEYLPKGKITAELLRRTLRYAIERKRNQRELIDRSHRITLLNRIIRQDIRNDVSLIVGWGDQLRGRVDPADRAAVDAILEASEHVVELTDTAAELMNTLATDASNQTGACALYPLLDAEIDRLQRHNDVEVVFDAERESPGNDPDGRLEEVSPIVVASPMLGSVFKQLFSNAVRHNDSETPRVTVTTDVTSDRVAVRIGDDGVGISDSQKTLFTDPEARFDDRSGMGAGLSLVTTVLEGIGGTLEFEDNTSRGTVVTVTLERVAE